MTHALASGAIAFAIAGYGQTTPAPDPFAEMGLSSEGPGCGAGVSVRGERRFRQDAGMADLEHRAPITAATVFEAGSASKQFTAAAILLLAKESRLSLTDSVRLYLPELPAYADEITIDDLLGHTSGLRDWRWIRGLAGWPPGTAVHTNQDVLIIASRQEGLNHAPGTAFSYTNTGYNLLAIVVERITGESLAAFTNERIFRPLNMSHTRWRTNFREVVPDRAIAYRRDDGSRYAQDMPFENAYGAGGLLTTVDDILIWNEALESERLGAYVTRGLQEPGHLRSGEATDYARRLMLRRFGGVAEVGHGGVTNGYVSYVARYPDDQASVVVLCNSPHYNPRRLAEALVEPFLKGGEDEPPTLEPHQVTPVSGRPMWRPEPAELDAITGRYRSREIGADYRVDLINGRLRLAIDEVHEQTWTLSPTFVDTLVFGLGSITLDRSGGTITGFTMDVERALGLRFERVQD